MVSDLGTVRIIQEQAGKKTEMAAQVVGLSSKDLVRMLTDFMVATGWKRKSILEGLESIRNDIQEEIEEDKNDNDN